MGVGSGGGPEIHGKGIRDEQAGVVGRQPRSGVLVSAHAGCADPCGTLRISGSLSTQPVQGTLADRSFKLGFICRPLPALPVTPLRPVSR